MNRKIIFAIVPLILFVSLSFSQQYSNNTHGRPDLAIQKRVEQLNRELELTHDQKQKISEILIIQQNSFSQPGELTREERMKKAEESRERTRTAIISVLTSEQAAKFRGAEPLPSRGTQERAVQSPERRTPQPGAQEEQRRPGETQRAPQRGQFGMQGGMQAGVNIDTLEEQLKLTSDQKKKIEEIYASETAELQKMRENISSMQTQDRSQMMSMMNSLRERREKTNSEIEKILTPEQATRFREINENASREMRERSGQRPESPTIPQNPTTRNNPGNNR